MNHLRSVFETDEQRAKSRRASVQSTASGKSFAPIAIVPASHRVPFNNGLHYSRRRQKKQILYQHFYYNFILAKSITALQRFTARTCYFLYHCKRINFKTIINNDKNEKKEKEATTMSD
uniref:Uncharacterized protein n=1 Tax=Panagrolaimus sp. ES5 TaxID=591445 RepID=A0AC34GR18_9BILA